MRSIRNWIMCSGVCASVSTPAGVITMRVRPVTQRCARTSSTAHYPPSPSTCRCCSHSFSCSRCALISLSKPSIPGASMSSGCAPASPLCCRTSRFPLRSSCRWVAQAASRAARGVRVRGFITYAATSSGGEAPSTGEARIGEGTYGSDRSAVAPSSFGYRDRSRKTRPRISKLLEEERREALAITAAQRQARSTFQDELIVPMEQGMHFTDELDVDESGSVNAYEERRIELLLQLTERLAMRVAMATRVNLDPLGHRLNEFDVLHREHDHFASLGKQQPRTRSTDRHGRSGELCARWNEELGALDGARQPCIVERLENVVDGADGKCIHRTVRVGRDEDDIGSHAVP